MKPVIQDEAEEHRRKRFLEAVNGGFAALRGDPAESTAYDQELRKWETTLTDGLEDSQTTLVER